MIPAKVLVIAGSDSGGGAGIQADIKTITMLGGHAMTAVTAITAQNTLAVEDVLPVPTDMVLRQIDVVVSDLGVDSVKIGMIGSAETAAAVAERLERVGNVPIVFDPVMVASSGAALADEATISAFRRLMAVASLITPNAPELQALTGTAIESTDALEQAAVALSIETGAAVLAKGGHILTPVVVDVLVEDGKVTRFQSDRVETVNTHGTGCTLASAIATALGHHRALRDAVDQARAYTLAALHAAPGFGKGHGPMGHALGTMPFEALRRPL